jgi:hypothetical protein
VDELANILEWGNAWNSRKAVWCPIVRRIVPDKINRLQCIVMISYLERNWSGDGVLTEHDMSQRVRSSKLRIRREMVEAEWLWDKVEWYWDDVEWNKRVRCGQAKCSRGTTEKMNQNVSRVTRVLKIISTHLLISNLLTVFKANNSFQRDKTAQ